MQNKKLKFKPGRDRYIIVKYHYIENPRDNRKAFHPCSIEEFERQVVFLKNNFEIGTVTDVFEAAQKKTNVNLCALTFDDGLNDQYQNVAPILQAHGIKGSFFPITKTLEGFLPATHAMHVALSIRGVENLIDSFNTFLETFSPDFLKKFFVGKEKRITVTRKVYDDIPTANLKETMNHIPRGMRDGFLARVFNELGLDGKEYARELFMSHEEILALHAAGHHIGSHSHSHEAFDTGDMAIVAKELQMSKKILEEMLGVKVTELVYPQSAPANSINGLLRDEGFLYALGTERRAVVHGDNPYHIPRYDTNDIRDFLNRSTF